MPIRIYVAPQIGAGQPVFNPALWTDTTGPYRSLLDNFVNVAVGDQYDEIDHPARLISICTVNAAAARLDAIEADTRVTAVTPSRAANQSGLSAILAAPFSSYSLAWRNAARTKLESWGVNTEWIGGSDTMKDVLRHVIKLFSVAQVANGHRQANVKLFLTQALDTQISAIPVAQRNAIGAWLNSRGIDTSWITGTTTVRQVVHSLPGHFPALYGRAVLHRFAGEDF